MSTQPKVNFYVKQKSSTPSERTASSSVGMGDEKPLSV
jgi:hypothetical protein